MATEKKYVSLSKLTQYDGKIKSFITTADAQVLADAKAFAEGLGVNYDVAGAAATAEANAKAHADGKDTAIAEAKKAGTDAQAAAEAADAKAVAAQGEVDALEKVVADLDAFVGDIPEGYTEETVIGYINKVAEETLNAASGGSSESAASVLAALNTYKTEANAKIIANETAAANAQAAADGAQGYAEGVAADLAEAVEALEGADSAQVERIAALEGQIVGLSGAMHFEGVKTEVPADGTGYEQGDVIIVGNKEYVLNGDKFVEFGDVSAQAEAITELTGRMDTAEADIDEAQADITALEGAVATKAEKADMDAAVGALEEADEAQIERIAALEGKFGGAEGSVEDMIADAKAEAISAAATDAATKDEAVLAAAKKYADDEDATIEASVTALQSAVDAKAAAADLTALTGRVTTAEGEIDTLQSEMDAVEALAAANEAAIAALQTAVGKKAEQADLEAAVARIAANEEEIASFVEVSESEINSLFA